MAATIWLRHEVKENEERTPLTPHNAKILLDAGHTVIVEKSPCRIFKDEEYQSIGCTLVETNSWINDAPLEAYILGLKELKEEEFPLKHKHIYFAHIFKGQDGAKSVFARYHKGGGHLYDLEFLMNEEGRRVSAFGFWAGYIGAAISVETFIAKESKLPLPSLRHYYDKNEWLNKLKSGLEKVKPPKSIIIGAKGRCGSGAIQLLKDIGLESTPWDMKETSVGGPFQELIEHDIFINCVLMSIKIPPFINKELLEKNQKLSVIGDVSCDPNSDLNPIAIYQEHTSWERPQLEIGKVSVIAVDNLPSVLPKESSQDFSDQLIPHLLKLCSTQGEDFVWSNAAKIFKEKSQKNGL